MSFLKFHDFCVVSPPCLQRHGLLLCWHFIVVSPEPKPIEKLMLKLIINAQMRFVCWILAESIGKADCYSVSQHSSKPNVGRSLKI
jgi:hypothetical protein